MNLKIFDSPEALAEAAADELFSCVKEKPASILCLATGDTPLKTYQILVDRSIANGLDFSSVHFVGLDEWVGVPSHNSGSCAYFLRRNLFDPLNIVEDRIHLFDAVSPDLNSACTKMDNLIAGLGGIDLMIVGIGMNGHVGFNEPGVSLELNCHVIELDEVTKDIGQKYFDERIQLEAGITLGFQNIMKAKKVILMANGLKKADIIKRMLEEPISERCPASILRKHQKSCTFLDSPAASKLSPVIARVSSSN